MASILKVDTITGVATAGSIAITGEGNSTTTNLQNGLAKAWGQFEGADATVDDSLNTASLTDNGTGDFSANFTNNMGNASYGYAGAADVTAASASNGGCFPHAPATTDLDIETASGGNLADRNNTTYVVHGDLA